MPSSLIPDSTEYGLMFFEKIIPKTCNPSILRFDFRSLLLIWSKTAFYELKKIKKN
jgi:hypothetical protein